jgi:hypothetical protein
MMNGRPACQEGPNRSEERKIALLGIALMTLNIFRPLLYALPGYTLKIQSTLRALPAFLAKEELNLVFTWQRQAMLHCVVWR